MKSKSPSEDDESEFVVEEEQNVATAVRKRRRRIVGANGTPAFPTTGKVLVPGAMGRGKSMISHSFYRWFRVS